jgi:hypothetical protein
LTEASLEAPDLDLQKFKFCLKQGQKTVTQDFGFLENQKSMIFEVP